MSTPSHARRLAICLLAAIAIGCGSTAPSAPVPSGGNPAPAGPSSAASGSVLPSAAPTATPTPAASPVGQNLPPTACLSLGAPDCERAARAAIAALPAGSPDPIYLHVGPFGCSTGERCPTTLVSRPEGDVVVEFAGVPAVTVHVTARADGSLGTAAGETFGIILAPSSAPLGRPGPIPFTLGHCGLYSGVDVDASWWDPVGPIDAENGDAVNAAEGTLAFLDPTHATFASLGGLTVSLVRRVGPKHLPFCD